MTSHENDGLSLKTLQLNASQHTIIKEDQLSSNNSENIHDFPVTDNDLYVTLLRHSLSHLHIKQI